MIASKSTVSFSHFDDLTDPRMDRTKRHLLIDMVVIALCAAIYGAEGWADSSDSARRRRTGLPGFSSFPATSHRTTHLAECLLDSTCPSSMPACNDGYARSITR